MEQQNKSANYLEIKPEDLAKVNASRQKRETQLKIDPEQLAIAEFGKHYGWSAVEAVLENKITGETMAWLLEGARKVDASRLYDQSQAVLIGTAASNAGKKVNKFFRDATRDIVKKMRVES